jgi:MHS family proline/betaine transporter-like MFS transporter
LGLVGRYIRRRLDETHLFRSAGAPAPPHPISDVFRGGATRVGHGFVLVAALTLAFNVWFVFLPSHLVATGVVPLGPALGFGVIGLTAAAVTAPIAGRLSDRIGRRAVLIAGTLAMAAFAAPGYALARRTVPGVLMSYLVMGVIVGTLAVVAFVAELFPTGVRATGVALTYGVATAVFGGSAPLIATLLVVGGVAWAVPAYVAAVAVLALAAAVRADETAFSGLS